MITQIFKKTFFYLFLSIFFICFLLGIYFGYNLLTKNIHAVIPGNIYRSAQLNAHDLDEVTKKFHINSMINLRGPWATDHWYQVEKQFAKTHGIHYYSLKFSAYRLPPKKEIRELVYLLQTVPKPLIFHCEGGADRTGMASAISLILFKKNATISEVKLEASWHYNAISQYSVGYQVLRNYFAWLKKNRVPQSRENFLKWLNSNKEMKKYSGWFF